VSERRLPGSLDVWIGAEVIAAPEKGVRSVRAILRGVGNIVNKRVDTESLQVSLGIVEFGVEVRIGILTFLNAVMKKVNEWIRTGDASARHLLEVPAGVEQWMWI
jgi:hypothetical protein